MIRLAEAKDAAAITAIYNQGIAERCATFETEPREVPEIEAKLVDQSAYPTVVSTDAEGQVVGWASLSSYRPRACYAGIAEFSIYIDRSARGKGHGGPLLEGLAREAASRGYWKMLSRIFTFNQASRKLSAANGFREVGFYEKHGQLEGRWLDVVIVERLIPENFD